jgi:hypothetical protein
MSMPAQPPRCSTSMSMPAQPPRCSTSMSMPAQPVVHRSYVRRGPMTAASHKLRRH